MAKKKESIGLDIGAQSVKIVHLAQNSNSLELKSYKVIEFQSAEEKAIEIREALKSIQTFEKNLPLVISVEGVHVFIRVFKLPGVANNKLARIVRYEAQQQLPFPINEVEWSYQCLRRVSPEETDVLLCAVKTSVLNDLLNNVGKEVANVIPPIMGLNNLLKWNNYDDIKSSSDDAVMVLDIGAKTVNVIITEKNSLWFRTIPIGSEVVTQALSNEYGINFAEAEVLKKEKGEIFLDGENEGDSDKKRISTCIIKSLTRLTGEISRSIEVYSSSFNSAGPKKVFITGGGALLKNIADFFKKKFRTETVVLKNIRNVNILDSVNKEKWGKDLLKMHTAIGLGVHGLEADFSLTLLPKEIINKKASKNFQSYITAAACVLIFLGICFSAYNFQIELIYKANINKIESEIKSVDGNKMQLINMQKSFELVKTKVDGLNDIKDARKFWLEMLLELEGLLPQNVWIVGVQSPSAEKEEKDKKIKISDYSLYMAKVIDLKLTGKTTGTYQDIVILNDALNNSKCFVKGSSKVSSANPPEGGVRDFVIEVKANRASQE